MTTSGPAPDADFGGDLPEAAGRRLGAGAWSSGLSVADFASCLSLGMEPMAFVQGYAVMHLGGYSTFNYRTMFSGLGAYAQIPSGPGRYSESWQCPHGFVGGEHRRLGYNFERPWVEDTWITGWNLAFDRMLEEAESLGAHGVIGVADDMPPLAGGGATEFRIVGTAVAIPGTPVPPRPFTTYLSGQRLVKLIEAGFMPVSAVAACSSVQMIGYCITHYQLTGTAMGNWSGAMSGGVAGVHSVVQVGKAQRAARHLVRERVRRQLGHDVLHGAKLQAFEQKTGESDLTIQCVLRGTKVRRFKEFDTLAEAKPVVRLS